MPSSRKRPVDHPWGFQAEETVKARRGYRVDGSSYSREACELSPQGRLLMARYTVAGCLRILGLEGGSVDPDYRASRREADV